MHLKEVIKEQRRELEAIGSSEKLVPRALSETARGFLKHPNILVITGVRRCGKSIFSYMLAKDDAYGYINFDDERLLGLGTEDLNRVLEAFYELYGDINIVILDEVQGVAGWELFANRLRRTKKVIITGSNSNLLSGELATHLTGRHLDVTLHPFSLGEFLLSKGSHKEDTYTTREKAELLTQLREYMRTGGFPEAYRFGELIVRRIYEDIIIKDVIMRYRIRKRNELKQLARFLVTNAGSEITYSRLSRDLGVKHVSTISNWISYLKEAFLVIELERFDFKLRQQFVAPKKVYCMDNAIMKAIGFNMSENTGHVMENIVAVELQRRRSYDPTLEIFYWKDHQQNEVDFVIKNGPDIEQLIQVTFAESREDVREREITGILRASGQLHCGDLTVITWDFEGEEVIQKKRIRFQPLWKWLL